MVSSPPSADESHITSFQQELSELQDQIIESIILGDMDAHHIRWLGFSNGHSPADVQLKHVCDEADLRQLVKEPTRNEYLLDLCLSDLKQVQVQIKPKIADHHALLATVKCTSFVHRISQRQVWHFKGAAWQNIRCEVKEFDWQVLKQ